MDTNTMLLVFGGAALILVTIAGTRWASTKAPGTLSTSVEHETAKLATDALMKLSDTSHEDAVIAAATARKGLKMKLLIDVQSAVNAKLSVPK